MSVVTAEACRWRDEGGGEEAARRCLAFLDEVGIEVDFLGEGATGQFLGAPMLAHYGMTADLRTAIARGIPAFPEMSRWLR